MNTHFFSLLNKQTDLREQHSFILCLYVVDPATFQASNSVLVTLFTLFIQLWKKKNISEFVYT